MRKAITAASAVAALCFMAPALADEGFSYSFVELGYTSTEIDDLDVEGDGLGLRGSIEFTDMFHGFASYSDMDLDFDVGATEMEIGAGLAWSISPNVDFVGTLSYLNLEVDLPAGFGSVDDSAIALGAGLRGRVGEQLELTGGLKYAEFDEGGNDTAFNVGGRYYFTKMFALGADIGFNEDGTSWTLGGRFDFGNK
jgi:hypothetical protein